MRARALGLHVALCLQPPRPRDVRVPRLATWQRGWGRPGCLLSVSPDVLSHAYRPRAVYRRYVQQQQQRWWWYGHAITVHAHGRGVDVEAWYGAGRGRVYRQRGVRRGRCRTASCAARARRAWCPFESLHTTGTMVTCAYGLAIGM